MFAERARAYGVPVAFCNLVGGQDELVFDGHSFVVDADRCRGRARASSSSPTCCCGSSAASPGARRGAARRPRRDLRRARARRPRLRPQERLRARVLVGLSGGIDSALVALIAADALGAEQPHLRGDALPALERGDPGRRPGDRRQPRRRADRAPDRDGDGGLRRDPGGELVGRRPRGRERAGADPRQPADGALQRPRRARADDRQQERDVGRLRDPLRRHGGRAGGDQGRAEAARLRAGRAPQRARRARAGPRDR